MVHRDKYDYSKVVYVNNRTKSIIICPKHGDFLQTPNDHLREKGCPRCGYEKISILKSSNLTEFMAASVKKHALKFDYSEFVYTNSHTNGKIKCPIHGIFSQSPNAHLAGKGCPKCAGFTITTDEFINKSKQIHHNKYDYSIAKYKDCYNKIDIICPFHGIFHQRSSEHLVGKGCRKCALDPEINKGGFKKKTYIFPNGKRVKIQGYEDWTIDYLLKNNIGSEEMIVEKHKPVIYYIYEKRQRIYFPDCYLPSYNTIVETKSIWLWNRDRPQIKAKIKASLKKGFNFRLVVWDKKRLLKIDRTYKP